MRRIKSLTTLLKGAIFKQIFPTRAPIRLLADWFYCPEIAMREK
jgi:hypothetical protein